MLKICTRKGRIKKYLKEPRERIFERYMYTCALCGVSKATYDNPDALKFRLMLPDFKVRTRNNDIVCVCQTCYYKERKKKSFAKEGGHTVKEYKSYVGSVESELEHYKLLHSVLTYILEGGDKRTPAQILKEARDFMAHPELTLTISPTDSKHIL